MPTGAAAHQQLLHRFTPVLRPTSRCKIHPADAFTSTVVHQNFQAITLKPSGNSKPLEHLFPAVVLFLHHALIDRTRRQEGRHSFPLPSIFSFEGYPLTRPPQAAPARLCRSTHYRDTGVGAIRISIADVSIKKQSTRAATLILCGITPQNTPSGNHSIGA